MVTRSNNRPSIEAGIKKIPEAAAIHWHYVDLPRWAMFWKKGPRGMRLYYLMWQVAALREMRRLHKRFDFVYVWHVTIANAWIGSLAAFAGPPFIYGPVGGGVRAPLRLIPSLGLRGGLYEWARETVRLAARYFNPLARASWRRSRLILAQNKETAAWFPPRYRSRVKIFQHAILATRPEVDQQRSDRNHTAVVAARLVPWKGITLAIQAVEMTTRWRLIICGSGPDEKRLKRIVRQKGLQERVEFRGRIEQDELFQVLATEADAFIFPSLHDDAPLAVAEAVVAGLPIICLDIGGPPLIASGQGLTVDTRSTTSVVVRELARALERAGEFRVPSEEPGEHLLLENRVTELRRIIEEAPGG